MPHINRIRVNNVKYNFGTQVYDDFVMRFNCQNTIYDLAVVVEKGVGGLRPLQYDVRSAFFVERDEAAVQFATLLFEHTHHPSVELHAL